MKDFKRTGGLRRLMCCLGVLAFLVTVAPSIASAHDDVKKGKTTEEPKKGKVKKGKVKKGQVKKGKVDECAADSECRNNEICKKGKCGKRKDDECTADTDCRVNEFCNNGKCKKTKDDQCSVDDDCRLNEVCEDGKCKKRKDDECTVDTDCRANEICKDGKCKRGERPDECAVDADCDDANDTTTDTCVDGTCSHESTPPAAQEICGDCVDNDGNGMADFEDSACCAPYVMEIAKGRIAPKKSGASRLRLRSTLAHSGMESINPTEQDVVLQIRPAGGTDILCARIPASSFMKRGKRGYKSWHKNSLPTAQGITDLKFKFGKNGRLGFKAFGKKVNLTNPQAGPLQVTVGFYNAAAGNAANSCSSTLGSFEAKGKALIAR